MANANTGSGLVPRNEQKYANTNDMLTYLSLTRHDLKAIGGDMDIKSATSAFPLYIENPPRAAHFSFNIWHQTAPAFFFPPTSSPRNAGEVIWNSATQNSVSVWSVSMTICPPGCLSRGREIKSNQNPFHLPLPFLEDLGLCKLKGEFRYA
ncbi:hypothetical protein CDAR_591501 [Caerostris darwini]|uniref:Uncharacterized protein n=1 Tax=Caerostris darwini TaxID=1538125 RepID=A0AAV4PI21_9ARAC|nr:hypothetical protein CDAR_591501 [Caerostris darwini]